jgi:hypothetical protein
MARRQNNTYEPHFTGRVLKARFEGRAKTAERLKPNVL